MSDGSAVSASAIRTRNLTKRFGGIAALDAVDFDVAPGEVHALLGENGAGKTTLCNILSGVYRADAGSVLVDGHEVNLRNPGQAIAAGVGMVHQHFRLVERMSVAENIHLGWPDTPRVVSRARLEERSTELMDQVGLRIDPSVAVWQLSVGEQQRVEILRVLARGARVLILDEPTAVLSAQEARELFEVIRRLAADGRSIIFISHKLNEVLEVSDRITVLRGGRHIVTQEIAGTTARHLARMMTGEEREMAVEHRQITGEPVLELSGVSAHSARGLKALRNVSLAVRAGEILGIAGVSGNGQTELAEVIDGTRSVTSGSITINGTPSSGLSVRAITDLGVGHIPEDRLGVAMVSAGSVVDNAILRSYWRGGISGRFGLSRSAARSFTSELVRLGRVKTRSIESAAGQMSGGNQQRLVARREALIAERVLIAAHPTRGLDVLAAHEVQTSICERRDAGCAVLLISDDLDEVILMSDRIAVMYEGEIMGIVDASEVDREQIGLMMGGRRKAEQT